MLLPQLEESMSRVRTLLKIYLLLYMKHLLHLMYAAYHPLRYSIHFRDRSNCRPPMRSPSLLYAIGYYLGCGTETYKTIVNEYSMSKHQESLWWMGMFLILPLCLDQGIQGLCRWNRRTGVIRLETLNWIMERFYFACMMVLCTFPFYLIGCYEVLYRMNFGIYFVLFVLLPDGLLVNVMW